MSSYDRAKQALGSRLRELRLDARLTGSALADTCGWHKSKVSKIESGRTRPTDQDIEAWSQACHRPDLTAELVASLRSLDEMYVEFRRLFRTGRTRTQQSRADIEAKSRQIRNFEHTFVPGLLQTAEYAYYRFAEAQVSDPDAPGPADYDDAVEARMKRQENLYRPGKQHHFVITEAVLRLLLCPPEVMMGQLGQLMTFTTLATIRLGVIPFGVHVPIAPVHGFWIYDNRVVYVEHLTGELKLTQGSEIWLYHGMFDQLAGTAVYGTDARAVISRALADLAA